jgi:hypothetical protein
MTERLKLRHKVTGEEKGPYWVWPAATWVKLWNGGGGEYDFIRSSECYDKHGNEIFEGDMVSGVSGPEIIALDIGHHSSVSSSWLRRNVAHWQLTGISGVCRRMSVMAKRSSWAIAIQIRGISPKWWAMWHSSPSPK